MRWQLRDRVIEFGRRPLVMGIINVTPDSFSDGGRYLAADAAIRHALRLVEEGAELLDIGGESTRPGAEPVAESEELRRVMPVVEALATRIAVPLSIDTSKAEVARRALAAGATIINDVTGLTGDPKMPEIALQTGAGVIVMHMQGEPRTMQIDPRYRSVVADLHTWFKSRLAALADVGIDASRVVLDPGIGFGKRLHHNRELLAGLEAFRDLGRPICLGVSRKGFINRVLGREGAAEIGSGGTIGVIMHALARGMVQIARVHDVASVHDAIRLFVALEESATGVSVERPPATDV